MSQSVTASGPGVSAPNYVGINLSGINYWDNEFKFINLFKQASTNTNDGITMMDTLPVANQQGDINVDADGYPKSMIGISGQTFTAFQYGACTNAGNYNLGNSNLYRLTVTGQGTIVALSDISSIVSVSSTGSAQATFSAKTITIPANSGVTTVKFITNFGGGGMKWQTLALPNIADYLRNMSMCQDSLADAFLAGGSIFQPLFKSALSALGISRIRFMDALATMRQSIPQTVTASINATSGVIPAWGKPTGDYKMTFNTGQQLVVHCVYNSTTMDFKGVAASAAITSGWLTTQFDWSHRAKATNFSYATDKGIPIEVALQLCNELGVDPWINVPVTIDTDPTWLPAFAALCRTGAGSTLPAFTGSTGRIFPELSNEIWNTAGGGYSYPEHGYADALGKAQFPTAGDFTMSNWIGKTVASIGDAFFAEYGLSEAAFRARVCVMMPGQSVNGSGDYYLNGSLASNFWTSRAWTHHIAGICLAPYMTPGVNFNISGSLYLNNPPGGATSVQILWDSHPAGNYNVIFSDGQTRACTLSIAGSTRTLTWSGALTGSPTTDASTDEQYLILMTADPVKTFFDLAYGNVSAGVTYSSVEVNGWAAAQLYWIIAEMVNIAAGGPWGSTLEYHGYEAGTQFAPGNDGRFTWNVIMAASNDPRMEFIYHDPTNQLYLAWNVSNAYGKPGFLQSCKNIGFTAVNQFSFCAPQSKFGEYEVITSLLQTISPLSAAPPKFRGVAKYAGGGVAQPVGVTGTVSTAETQSTTAVSALTASNAMKFNPSDYMMQSSTYGTTLATNQAEIDELALYPVDGYGMSISWGCDVGINYNNPANILQQYPGFQRIADVFNYLQSKIPGARMVLYVDYAVYNPGAFSQAKLTTSNWGNNYVIPTWIANCGGNLVVPNSYGSGSSTTYQVAKIYGTSSYYGIAWSQWDSVAGQYFASYPAFWNRGINQARINYVEALSMFTFPITAGPLSGQTLGINANKYIELILNNDETSWDFRSNPSSGQMFNPPSYVNILDKASPANFWAAQLLYYKKLRQFFPNTQCITCESFGFGGDGGASTNPDQAAFVNDYLRRGGLSSIEGFSATPGIGLSSADQYGADFIAGRSFANSAKCGFLGINGAPLARPFTLPSASVQSLVGESVNVAQYQPTDYSGYLPTGVASYSAAAIQALIASAAFLRSPYRIWSKTDNRFQSNSWRTYMQPNIIAAAKPNAVMPTGLMYAIATPTQTGTHPPSFSWPAVTGAGTGIFYVVFRDGAQIATNVNATSYTDPQSAGQVHSYAVAMANSNGTGPKSPGRSITAT